MKSYLEASLDFMESKEMRDYLRKELPKFQWAAMCCAEIAAYAPAPVEKKLPVLEQIAREAEPDPAFDGEPYTAHAARFAQSCRAALKERCSDPEGAMFWLEEFEYDGKADCLFGDAFFTEFDAAIGYLEQLAKEYPESCSWEGLSYTITKYVPDSKGGLEESCIWYLNNARELWYFDYNKEPQDWMPLVEYLGDLNLPVPFQPGDIVTAAFPLKITNAFIREGQGIWWYASCLILRRGRLSWHIPC